MEEAAPRGGIFWLVGRKLVILGVPLSEAEPYGDYLTHPRSHLEVWTQFQQRGTVPADVEYEELLRGRVSYSAETQRFTLLADQCILGEKDTISKITTALKLPRKREKERDAHCQHFICLRSKFE